MVPPWLAGHAQLAALFREATKRAVVLPSSPSNRGRQIRLEGPGGVERPTLRVAAPEACYRGRESVRGGGAHACTTELTTSRATSTDRAQHRSVLSPRPGGPNFAVAVALEAPGIRPVHESRRGRQRASGRRRKRVAVAAGGQQRGADQGTQSHSKPVHGYLPRLSPVCSCCGLNFSAGVAELAQCSGLQRGSPSKAELFVRFRTSVPSMRTVYTS